MLQIIKDGKVVARSKNLRGIYDYNRNKSHVVFYRQKGKELYVRFNDGAEVTTQFADASVLRDWLLKTRMFWHAQFRFVSEPEETPVFVDGVNVSVFPVEIKL